MLGLGLGLDVDQKLLSGGHIGGVISIQPGIGGNGKACVLQPLLHRDKIPGIDLTGAGAALDGLADTVAVGGDFSGLCQREISVALEQNGAFCQCRTKELQVLFLVFVQFHKYLLFDPVYGFSLCFYSTDYYHKMQC